MATSPYATKEPIRILLVEDDEDDYLIARDLLRDIGHTAYLLDWVPDAASAIDVMAEQRHDVYLVDYGLGVRTGIDLMREANARNLAGPIILLTGMADIRTDALALETGAMDYLAKADITPQLLERSLRYAIAKKRVESELAEARRRGADSAESERLHLARELHDGPLQELIGVRIKLGSIARGLDARAGRADIDAVADAMVVCIDRLRAICGHLRPPALGPFGLESAIRSHAEGFIAAHPEMNIELRLDADRLDFPESVRMAMFRIYQHAMTNIERHADARSVRITFQIEKELVKLEIADDGRGFEIPSHRVQLAQDGHYGLIGAAERAESIGGQIEIESAPNDGTRIRLAVPRARIVAGDSAGHVLTEHE